MQELENQLATSNIINLKGLNTSKVVFGCYVSLEDIDSGEEIKFQLLGPYESDISQNKISVTSPIGRALIGKTSALKFACRPPAARVIWKLSIFPWEKNNFSHLTFCGSQCHGVFNFFSDSTLTIF